MLRSAALSDEARDDHIGWFNESTIRQKIYKKEIKVEFVVEQMLKVLDEQINQLRCDDFQFLNKNLLKEPNDDVIKKLNKLHEEAIQERIADLEDEKKSVERIDVYENIDWLEQSEKPLFKKKGN